MANRIRKGRKGDEEIKQSGENEKEEEEEEEEG